MSMAEMTVTVPATAVATSVFLVGEVRGARSVGSNQDWCGGHAEELGQEEVEAQPRDVVSVRDDQPVFGRGHEEREESIGGAIQHAGIILVPRRVLEASLRKAMRQTSEVPLQLQRGRRCAEVVRLGKQLQADGGQPELKFLQCVVVNVKYNLYNKLAHCNA
jgi:hypothetical protein